MKLLLDQGLPRSALAALRASAHDVVHTADIALAKASDAEILEAARLDGRVIVTLDADFHALVAVRGLNSPSVIRLRREGCRAETAAGILNPVLERYRVDLEKGALISVKEHRITCHRLPVGRSQ